MEYLEKQIEDENNLLIKFKSWYDGLSPSDKCTVWPPAGSGCGRGLYNMEDKDLIQKFRKTLIPQPLTDKQTV
jgi:hypothetical protein